MPLFTFPFATALVAQLTFLAYTPVINRQARRMRKKAFAATKEAVLGALPAAPTMLPTDTPALPPAPSKGEVTSVLEIKPAPDPIFN